METQINTIKIYLMSGNRLSPMEAYAKWEVTRLAAIICTLRKRGMNIKMDLINNKKNNGKHSVYYLEK